MVLYAQTRRLARPGVVSPRCLTRRIPGKHALTGEIAAWREERNKKHTKAGWQFTSVDARVELRRLYPVFWRTRRGSHSIFPPRSNGERDTSVGRLVPRSPGSCRRLGESKIPTRIARITGTDFTESGRAIPGRTGGQRAGGAGRRCQAFEPRSAQSVPLIRAIRVGCFAFSLARREPGSRAVPQAKGRARESA